MTRYSGPTGDEPGRPDPESIDQALARLTAGQQGLPVEPTNDGRVRDASTRGGEAVRQGGRAVMAQSWFWPAVRWVVIVSIFLLLARCATSLDLTGGI